MRTPPPFVSFPNLETLAIAAADKIHAAELAQVHELIERRLPPATSITMLALLFGYSPRLIGAMTRRPERYYRRFQLRKGHGFREIWAPRVALKVIQKWLGFYLNRAIPWPNLIHGFVPGRSNVTAARAHCAADWVVSVDIRDFFPSVEKLSVFERLTSLGYSRLAAHLICDLTTVANRLPQGSPASPVLANLVFYSTDRALAEVATSYDANVTRYADDITFSGRGAVPDALLETIIDVLTNDRWAVVEEKTRISAKTQRMEVLGLLVNGERPRLRKRYRNRIRMMRYLLDRGVVKDDQVARRWRGHLAYENSVAMSDA